MCVWRGQLAGRVAACSDNEISDRDVDELDEIAHNTHHEEPEADGTHELEILLARRLGALLHKAHAVLHKVDWGLGKLFDVGHCLQNE